MQKSRNSSLLKVHTYSNREISLSVICPTAWIEINDIKITESSLNLNKNVFVYSIYRNGDIVLKKPPIIITKTSLSMLGPHKQIF